MGPSLPCIQHSSPEPGPSPVLGGSATAAQTPVWLVPACQIGASDSRQSFSQRGPALELCEAGYLGCSLSIGGTELQASGTSRILESHRFSILSIWEPHFQSVPLFFKRLKLLEWSPACSPVNQGKREEILICCSIYSLTHLQLNRLAWLGLSLQRYAQWGVPGWVWGERVSNRRERWGTRPNTSKDLSSSHGHPPYTITQSHPT